jgi:thiol-disulfide isomerase/thioredoxin
MTDNHIPQDTGHQADLPDWLQEMTAREPRQKQADQHAPVQQRFSMVSIVVVLAVIGLLAMIGYALYDRNKTQPDSGPAPTFSVTTFGTELISPYDNQKINLADLKGQVVVVNFWAINCPSCVEEAPLLERLWQEYGEQGVLFLGINTRDNESDAVLYLSDHGLTFPNALDKGSRIEKKYGITGTPETFIIDKDGNIVRHFVGSVDQRTFRDEIERALGA